MFWEMSQAGQKVNRVLAKNLFAQTHLTVLNNLSIKIFIKRKTRAGNAYAYRMLEFQDETWVFLEFYFTPDNRVLCEAPLVRYNSIFFAGHCRMSGAHIQTWRPQFSQRMSRRLQMHIQKPVKHLRWNF